MLRVRFIPTKTSGELEGAEGALKVRGAFLYTALVDCCYCSDQAVDYKQCFTRITGSHRGVVVTPRFSCFNLSWLLLSI